MNILIIGNPIASKGDARRKMVRLSDLLTARGHRVSSHMTRFAGDAKAFVSRVSQPLDRLVVVGGDGTLNEVINGLSASWNVPILQLPCGNANLLARELSLPATPEAAAPLVETGTVIPADLAGMNGQLFIMVAGIGFDARVTRELKRVRKGAVSNLSYLFPVLRSLRMAPQVFDIVVDGTCHVRGGSILACNIKNYAGLVDLAPGADICSGQFDIIVLPHVTPAFLAVMAGAAALGRTDQVPGIRFLKGRSITVRSSQPIPVELDGDYAGDHPEVNITMLSRKIPLIIP